MSRNLMPKSGAMAPYIVVNRDAAVAGVFSVDGEAGAVVLTSKYLQISKYNLDQQELNTRLSGMDTSINNTKESVSSINESIGGINTALGGINTSIENINTGLDTKAGKGANNDITELNSLTKAITIAQGGTGSSTVDGAKTALELDRFSQDSGTETRVYSGDKSSRLTIQNSGAWGAYSDVENKWISLSVEQGGTGVTDREALWSVVRPQGPTPLSGDPVNDYDATTKRWVQNLVSSGTVGPTMNVINEDPTEPDNNTIVYGGDVWSTYKVAGSDYVKLGYRSKVTIGGESTGELRLVDSRTGGVSKTWEMPTDSGALLSTSDIGTSGNKIPKLDVQNTWSKTQVFQEGGLVTQSIVDGPSLADKAGPHHVSYVKTGGTIRLGAKFFASFAGDSLRRAIIQVTTDADVSAQIFAFDQRGDISSAKGTVQWSGSDVRIKENFEPVQKGAWDRISKIGICEYTFKYNSVPQRGYLAQQMEAIDPIYVFSGGQSVDDNGKEFEILNVNDKAVMADIITVVQELQKQIVDYKEQLEYMQKELNALRNSK